MFTPTHVPSKYMPMDAHSRGARMDGQIVDHLTQLAHSQNASTVPEDSGLPPSTDVEGEFKDLSKLPGYKEIMKGGGVANHYQKMAKSMPRSPITMMKYSTDAVKAKIESMKNAKLRAAQKASEVHARGMGAAYKGSTPTSSRSKFILPASLECQTSLAR